MPKSVWAQPRQTAMLEIQHLAFDQDRYVNQVIEEAARDLLKKYREKSGKKRP
jgi:hypothetical protein